MRMRRCTCEPPRVETMYFFWNQSRSMDDGNSMTFIYNLQSTTASLSGLEEGRSSKEQRGVVLVEIGDLASYVVDTEGYSAFLFRIKEKAALSSSFSKHSYYSEPRPPFTYSSIPD
jgi:hypothetical protein